MELDNLILEFLRQVSEQYKFLDDSIKKNNYENNRDRTDNHVIREEEMTQGTINHLKREFEEDRKRFEQTQLECARIREYKRRTICDK